MDVTQTLIALSDSHPLKTGPHKLDYSQDSKTKHDVKTPFLLLTQLQLPYFGDRETDDEEILKDIDRAIDPSHCVKIDTFPALHGPVPGVRDRMALEDCDDEKGERADDAENHYCPALRSEGACWEDLKVECEDGDFD
jgi:hypothetical protein